MKYWRVVRLINDMADVLFFPKDSTSFWVAAGHLHIIHPGGVVHIDPEWASVESISEVDDSVMLSELQNVITKRSV